jgi:AcrR family transcriptional regulator
MGAGAREVEATETLVRHSPDETRLRIIAAAREIYARCGQRGTTTREVAERAGVNEATIFRHFGTKQALLSEMHRHYCRVERVSDALTALSGEIECDLTSIGCVMMENLERNEDLIRRSIGDGADPESVALTLRTPLEIRAILAGYMERQISAGKLTGDPGALAQLFMGMVLVHVVGKRLWPGGPPAREDLVKLIVGIFLNGARAR